MICGQCAVNVHGILLPNDSVTEWSMELTHRLTSLYRLQQLTKINAFA